MVRDRPALHDGTLWKEGPRQEKVCRERKTSQHFFFLKKRVIVHMGMLVITGIHLSGPYIKEGEQI